MAKRDKPSSDLAPATWPFPASVWVLVLFWLVVVVLAVADLLFA
jgi:hypothetical protein